MCYATLGKEAALGLCNSIGPNWEGFSYSLLFRLSSLHLLPSHLLQGPARCCRCMTLEGSLLLEGVLPLSSVFFIFAICFLKGTAWARTGNASTGE